ncbi:hypothetical protein IMZ48_05000 [Candidatus Bathyarchaeota archaeon]|nr:hypothetical protein [Candidatus Bathyarchaeota archaeon]
MITDSLSGDDGCRAAVPGCVGDEDGDDGDGDGDGCILAVLWGGGWAAEMKWGDGRWNTKRG